jgi:hypothetical protein
VYLDAYVWYCYRRDHGGTVRLSSIELLDSALRERVAEAAVQLAAGHGLDAYVDALERCLAGIAEK